MNKLHILSSRVLLSVGLGLVLIACAAPVTKPSVKITTPANNTTVKGPKVLIEAKAENFSLVAAGPEIKAGEGHLHFFVDVPASAVAVGALIPADQPTIYIHAGKDPLASRELELSKGQHIVTVVVGNSAHLRLAQPEPVSITINVE